MTVVSKSHALVIANYCHCLNDDSFSTYLQMHFTVKEILRNVCN